ncbi:hypothetical protein MCEREM21A_00002 [Sphingomonadaceae bacterium]
MVKSLGLLAMALAAGASPNNSHASEPNAGVPDKSQPVFLLSERDLGSGFKVCFLSNGLQMRIASSQPCPYPLKAPPFIETKREPEAAASIAANTQRVKEPKSTAENTTVSPSTTQAKPLQSSQQRQVEPSTTASLVSSNPQTADPIQKPKAETAIAKQIDTQSSSEKAASPVLMQSKESAETQDDNDEIATKAIRRCERIGFKLGTEPFKACALEQIRLITIGKP